MSVLIQTKEPLPEVMGSIWRQMSSDDRLRFLMKICDNKGEVLFSDEHRRIVVRTGVREYFHGNVA